VNVRALLVALSAALLLAGCAAERTADGPSGAAVPPAPLASEASEEPTSPRPVADTDPEVAEPDERPVAPRPDWLGSRVLPRASDGFGERLPTPAELVDRRLETPPLPDPAPAGPPGPGYFATVSPVPAGVAARSTWSPDCPVTLDELRYLTVTFVGFDDRDHTGELIVHADVAEDVVTVFGAIHAARFPLEEVRVIAAEELALPPTGDGNVSSAFVCRPTVGGTRWSEHAYGRAVDLNPFHNPYVRGDLVIPELASAYTSRDDLRPGMIVAGDAVTEAFASVGWRWGGDWTGSATDPMHFSTSGR
jgi:hypothetical protein